MPKCAENQRHRDLADTLQAIRQLFRALAAKGTVFRAPGQLAAVLLLSAGSLSCSSQRNYPLTHELLNTPHLEAMSLEGRNFAFFRALFGRLPVNEYEDGTMEVKIWNVTAERICQRSHDIIPRCSVFSVRSLSVWFDDDDIARRYRLSGIVYTVEGSMNNPSSGSPALDVLDRHLRAESAGELALPYIPLSAVDHLDAYKTFYHLP